MGETSQCIPTVFRWEWPKDVTASVRSFSNPISIITNSDLELAGVLILWLMMEAVCQPLHEKRVALYSDNTPTVGWTKRLASRKSLVTEHFVQALALWIKTNKTCPLTTLHIEGKLNSISDVPFKVIWQHPGVALYIGRIFPNPVQLFVPPSVTELLDRLPAELKSSYAHDFHASDAAFRSGRVAQTTKNRESRWDNWCMYVQPLGVDPYLQTTPFGLRCRCLMGYAARVRSGYFGKESKFKLAQSLAQSQPLARRLQWTQISTQSN